MLDKKETAIYIKFKHVDCLLSKACPSETNNLTIEISPNPLFALTLNAKVPGKSDEVMPVQMTFKTGVFGAQTPEAYETLFEEIMKGEQSVSVRFDEIEYAWKIIDAIRALKPALYTYERGSKGPEESVAQFEKKHGMRWINLSKSGGKKMKLGVIGLGRMGAAIAHRALKAGHSALGYDPNSTIQKELQESGIQMYDSPDALAKEADVIWLMVPSGKIVDIALGHIMHAAKKDAIIIDGGNSNFADSVRRAKELAHQKECIFLIVALPAVFMEKSMVFA